MSEETQFDEVFDTQLDVKANPSGAWRAIQSQHAEITRLRAEVERLQRSLATIALLSDCSSSVGEARAALGDDKGEGDA